MRMIPFSFQIHCHLSWGPFLCGVSLSRWVSFFLLLYFWSLVRARMESPVCCTVIAGIMLNFVVTRLHFGAESNFQLSESILNRLLVAWTINEFLLFQWIADTWSLYWVRYLILNTRQITRRRCIALNSTRCIVFSLARCIVSRSYRS
jgi:hypothetical protein